MPDTVDTAQVARRSLRFATIDDAQAEINRIVAADRAGKLQCKGNWTAGQVMGHVASWISYSYEGYPLTPPPWFIRFILRRMVKKYLRNGMPAGRRIPGTENGTYGVDVCSTSDGAERLRRAFHRLASNEPAVHDSPAFGALAPDDRVQLNLRHAELHLSFLQY